VNEQPIKQKDCGKYKPAQIESTRYRIFFSLYCVGGLTVLGWVYKCVETSVNQFKIKGLPFWILLVFGVLLFGLMYWRIKIIKFLRVRESCQSRAVVVFTIFMVTMGLSLLDFGFNIYCNPYYYV